MSRERKSGAVVRFKGRKLTRRAGGLAVALGLLALCGGAESARAALQFDVFLGYDGIVPEASWFPMVCEVKNDGPTFTGTVELTSDNQSQTRRMTVELPTGTLKRLVLPVFSFGCRWSIPRCR